MAETLSKDSKIVVFDSAVNLTDANVNSVKQGVTVENIGKFEKIADDLSSVTKTDARAQALKFGESFLQISNSGATRYICTGEYGKTLINGLDLASSCVGTHVNGTSSPATTDVNLAGGSTLTSSDLARATITIAADGTLTSVEVIRRGTNYKAGDVFVIPGDTIGSGGATPANDLTITLTQADLNNAELVKEAFSTH